MLRIENISKSFNVGTANETRALKGVNLSLASGEFVIVIGSNGGGKSTILNAVGGMFPVDGGKILIGGKDVTSLAEHKRASYVGRVFQDPMQGTAANMTIEENLALAARRGCQRTLRRGLARSEREGYRKALAQLGLGLEGRMGAKVGLLSGGQRQALTLLMATLQRPDVLLLDEHTAALDPKTAAKVLHLSNALVREHKLTTLMVTHNMRDALKYGDRLVMMDEGRISYDISGEEKAALTTAQLVDKFRDVAVT